MSPPARTGETPAAAHHLAISLARPGHSLVRPWGLASIQAQFYMVDQKTALAELVRSFPQLSSSQVWEGSGNHDRQWYDFARLLSNLYERRDYESVRAGFDQLESFLAEGNSYVRGWVTGFLQFLQDVTSWSTPNSDAFMGFLGPNSRRLWQTLDAIRSDLADCPILEAEILMWRVAHPQESTRPAGPERELPVQPLVRV